jgi:hypothetical protein
MWNKIILIICLALLSANAYGEEQKGKFILVPKDGRVPFQATCFDDLATAILVSDKEAVEQRHILEIERQTALLRTECDKRVELQTISADAERDRLLVQLQSRQEQIDILNKKLSKIERIDIPGIITAGILGGIIVGGGTAIGINMAINKQQ